MQHKKISSVIISQKIKPSSSNQVEAKPFNPADYTKYGITREQILDFKVAFDIFDIQGTGKVQISEVKEAFINLGFYQQNNFTSNLFNHLERTTGELDFVDFLKLTTTKIGHKNTKAQTDMVFSSFDPKGNGKIGIYEFKQAIKALGDYCGEEQIEKMFRYADEDGDGQVTSEDFSQIVTKDKNQ